MRKKAIQKSDTRLFFFLIVCSLSLYAQALAQDVFDKLNRAQTAKEMSEVETELKSKASTDELNQYATNKSHNGRKRFMAFKARLNREPLIKREQQLIDALRTEKDNDFKVPATLELAVSSSDVSAQELRRMLSDKNEQPFVQVAAASSLSLRGDAAGKERALQAVINSEPWADFGIKTLENLRAKDVIPMLEKRANSTNDYGVKMDCRLAILRLRLVGLTSDLQIPVLKTALNNEDQYEVRKQAAFTLGSLCGDQAREALISGTRNSNSSIQTSALAGLEMGISNHCWSAVDVNTWLNK